MKAYLITTGTLFGLLTLVHIWRVIAEGSFLAAEPWYVAVTVVAAGMCLWAFRLLRVTVSRDESADTAAK